MEEMFSKKSKQACLFIREYRNSNFAFVLLMKTSKNTLKSRIFSKNKQVQDSFEFLQYLGFKTLLFSQKVETDRIQGHQRCYQKKAHISNMQKASDINIRPFPMHVLSWCCVILTIFFFQHVECRFFYTIIENLFQGQPTSV